jgi:hypothetical protein
MVVGQHGGAATYPPKKRIQRSIHLPSQLGSDVGNAFSATTDTQAEEKAHMEDIVVEMTERVLQEWPAEDPYLRPRKFDDSAGLVGGPVGGGESINPKPSGTLPRDWRLPKTVHKPLVVLFCAFEA